MSRAGLQDLEAVIAIARRGSFRAAAAELAMSTTALSHAIARLEADLGVRLFHRTTRSVSLTEAGRLFVEQVGAALQDIRGAFETISRHRDTPSGTIRINAAPSAAREIISPLVLEYVRRYPDMNLDLVTEGRLVDIVAEGFDLGVRVAGLVPSDMIAVPLGRPQRHAIVGSAEYLRDRGEPRTPPDLLKHDCIRVRLPDGDAVSGGDCRRDGEIVQVDVRGRIILDEASLARTAVRANIGLGFFMEHDVEDDIAEGHLIRVMAEWTPPFAGLCLYYSGRRNLSAGVTAFLALARELANRRSGA